MPYISKKLQKVIIEEEKKRKEEEDERKKKEEEERIEREQREEEERREQERREEEERKERERKDREQAERKEQERIENERKASALIALNKIKNQQMKTVFDEEIIDKRFGYSFTRTTFAGGTTSQVYKARHNDTEMIVKVISLKKWMKINIEHFMEESAKIIKFLGSEQSPYMIKVHEIFVKQNDKVYVFMEHCNAKTLDKMITNPLTEDELKNYAKSVAEAILFMHQKGVAHLDIHTKKIINKNSNGQLKLGFSNICSICWDPIFDKYVPIKTQLIKNNQNRRITKPKEKAKHLPPEVYSSDTCDGIKVDVWSWAILVCYLATKEYPFDLNNGQSIDEQWKAFCQRHNLNYVIKQVLTQCFAIDPSQRPIAPDLLKTWLV